MKAQLIIYQLTDSSDNSLIIEKIKSFSTWAKVVDNSWIVITDKSSSTVRDELRDFIGKNKGSFIVINVTGQGWGSYAISKEVTDWMKSNLK